MHAWQPKQHAALVITECARLLRLAGCYPAAMRLAVPLHVALSSFAQLPNVCCKRRVQQLCLLWCTANSCTQRTQDREPGAAPGSAHLSTKPAVLCCAVHRTWQCAGTMRTASLCSARLIFIVNCSSHVSTVLCRAASHASTMLCAVAGPGSAQGPQGWQAGAVPALFS